MNKEEKEEMIKYIEGGIFHLDGNIKPLRERLKAMLREKEMLQRLKKAIKNG